MQEFYYEKHDTTYGLIDGELYELNEIDEEWEPITEGGVFPEFFEIELPEELAEMKTIYNNLIQL